MVGSFRASQHTLMSIGTSVDLYESRQPRHNSSIAQCDHLIFQG